MGSTNNQVSGGQFEVEVGKWTGYISDKALPTTRTFQNTADNGPPRPHRTKRRHLTYAYIVLLGLLVLWGGKMLLKGPQCGGKAAWVEEYAEGEGEGNGEKDPGWSFDWDTITPSPSLIYHPCFSGLLCARLSTPLDYSDRSADAPRAAVALVKVPSLVPESSPSWGGPILINPGGPGGSGVNFVLHAGRYIQAVAGPQFSIIGFDPRGVNNTTPHTSCFDDTVDRAIWAVKGGNRALGCGGGEEFGEAFMRSRVWGQLCGRSKAGGEGLYRYLGTPAVARDMLAITERSWGGKVDVEGRPRRKGLQYWGFSYGSVLGLTFATMFPDNVERIIIDGVVDVPNYYQTLWNMNLADAEEVMSAFYRYCSLAGPLRCAMHAGTTPDDVKLRVQRLLAEIRRKPVPVTDSTGAFAENAPDFVTYSIVRDLIFRSLYIPLAAFEPLAMILAGLEVGNTEFLVGAMLQLTCPAPPTGDCPSGAPCNRHRDPDDLLLASEATPAILCSDGIPINTTTLANEEKYWRDLQLQSPTSGDLWTHIRLSCVGWQFQAVEGPPRRLVVNSEKWKDMQKVKTKNPMMVIGNTADPVTPLANAWRMKDGFEGAEVVVQEGFGHCSLNAPSACMATKVRAYLESGELRKGRRCQAESVPFLGGVGSGVRGGERDERAEAYKEIGRIWSEQRGWLGRFRRK